MSTPAGKTRLRIACVGPGRMARGIAIAFAFAGHAVSIVDLKRREPEQFDALETSVAAEIAGTFATMARLGLLDEADIPLLAARVSVVPDKDADVCMADAGVLFECVPEVLETKLAVLERMSKAAAADAIIASTTSTILVDDLSGAVGAPERFLNAHWLNPAYLVPLVEVQPGVATSQDATTRLVELLESIGKMPVVCAASPGFIVPRIQVLAMNEAARLVEEGVASAADIDKAIKYGFGFRFAVLGLLEFIDWGGGDILFYASRYLEGALGDSRFASPPIIARNMEEGRLGLRSGAGFLDYAGMDVDAYREGRLREFASLLAQSGLTRKPVLTD